MNKLCTALPRICILGGVAFGAISYAARAEDRPFEVTCRQAQSEVKSERSVAVTYPDPQNPTACEVHYRSDGRDEVLWKAQFEPGYCEQRALSQAARLAQQGWRCSSKLP